MLPVTLTNIARTNVGWIQSMNEKHVENFLQSVRLANNMSLHFHWLLISSLLRRKSLYGSVCRTAYQTIEYIYIVSHAENLSILYWIEPFMLLIRVCYSSAGNTMFSFHVCLFICLHRTSPQHHPTHNALRMYGAHRYFCTPTYKINQLVAV